MVVVAVPEGRSREECIEIKKEREQELRLMMKRLEAKYAALQVVPVISKLGTQRVCIVFVYYLSNSDNNNHQDVVHGAVIINSSRESFDKCKTA